ncbi:MAG: FecR domain-containing protein [Phycisphaerales bacterium]|jgi:hypothetical protein|nr:FecR domain-containing protein [Phycisphaerales bacterium]
MNTEERFTILWTDYLEGELDETGLAELRELLAGDQRYVELATDSLRTHRLLGMAEQDKAWRQDAFVADTMAKLPAKGEEFVDAVMHRLPDPPQKTEPAGTLKLKAWRLPLAAAAAVAVAVLATIIITRVESGPKTIARITALNGSVQWTTDGGHVRTDLEIGTPIHSGVLETLNHDSWLECEFLDGTKISLSGHSLATVSEHEHQKVLHLREGHMFADVKPQPKNKPMRVITPTAEAKVLGTKFQVACKQQSTSLRVKEGLVQVRRLADGSTSKVPAGHVIVAALEQQTEFKPERRKEFASSWKATVRRDISYGELHHASEGRPDSVYAKPLLWRGDDGKQKPSLIYVATLDTRTATPILQAGSSIRVRGRLRKDALVVFGFTAHHSKGGFAGKYSHAKRHVKASQGQAEYFEVEIPLKEFGRDRGLKHYAESPIGLELHQCWILTLDKDYGLEVIDVVLQN